MICASLANVGHSSSKATVMTPIIVTLAARIAAAIMGPLSNLIWHLIYPKGLDPLYPGLVVSAVVLVAVSMLTRKKPQAEAVAGPSAWH